MLKVQIAKRNDVKQYLDTCAYDKIIEADARLRLSAVEVRRHLSDVVGRSARVRYRKYNHELAKSRLFICQSIAHDSDYLD